MRPLAPYTPDKVAGRGHARRLPATRAWRCSAARTSCPRSQPPRHLAIQINHALHDLFCKYPEALLFGEDVAQKGGVYTVTKGLHKAFKGARVFNTLLDETMILGLAQGFANMGMLPIPEIQYLAYFHNACDQIRGEACSLQFFSNDQYRNPMVMRIASLGYQKRLRRALPQRQFDHRAARHPGPGRRLPQPRRRRRDDAAHDDGAGQGGRARLRLPRADRAVHDQGPVRGRRRPVADRVSGAGPGAWCWARSAVYAPEASDLVIFSFGNGVPMSLRAARDIEKRQGWKVRVVDLRWLQPLNADAIGRHAGACERILVVDEGRRSAGVGEGIITAVVEAGQGAKPMRRVVGEDTYTPLAGAALLVLPSEQDIVKMAAELA